MKAYLIEFGLTPASRARIGSPDPRTPKPDGDGSDLPPGVGGKFQGLIGRA